MINLSFARRSGSSRTARTAPESASPPFYALCVLLVLVFTMGGASRADVASLVFLRPAAAILLFMGLYWLQWEHVRAHKALFGLAAGGLAIVLLQLLPLPPFLWHQLPGRELIVAIDRLAGLEDQWRPLTMAPAATRNALWSLLPPFACLTLAVQLNRQEQQRILLLIIGLGLASAVLAMLQLLGDPQGPLYLYQVTNNGDAVGLFANRNHHALLLAALLPMLTVWGLERPRGSAPGSAASVRLRWIGAISAIGFVIPLILITGSRAGIVLGLLALIASGGLAWWMVRTQQAKPSVTQRTIRPSTKRLSARLAAGALVAGLVALVGVTIYLNRDLALARFLDQDLSEDARAKAFPMILEMIRLYLPLGSGFGSFEKVYKLFEEDAWLEPTYMNQAHNDWLDLPLTGGLPAILLIAAAIIWVAMTLLRHGFDPVVRAPVRRLGLIGGSFFALAVIASVSDYPLRVPSLACLLVLSMVWIGQMASGRGERKPGLS